MNIQDAAKRLIALGIPGKNKKEDIKSTLVKKDSTHVEMALVKYVEKMLVRWAYTEEVIQKPERHQHKNGTTELGRGKMSEWPDTTVEEAAAVWAVRQKWQEIGGKKRRFSKDKIDVIMRAASVIDERPFAVYILPPVSGPLSTQHLEPEDIKMKFVSEECDGLALFPGADNTEKADCLNKLVVIWVAAIEKVRAWKSAGIETQMKSDLGSKSENPPLAAKIDFSQIDPWLVDVPCPWPIDKPALLALRWLSWGKEFFKLPTALLKSDCDNLILLENLVDTRQFFKIDVIESAEWARSTRENLERQMRSSTSPAEQLALNIYREFIITNLPYKK